MLVYQFASVFVHEDVLLLCHSLLQQNTMQRLSILLGILILC
jgi:hypothetical protein